MQPHDFDMVGDMVLDGYDGTMSHTSVYRCPECRSFTDSPADHAKWHEAAR